MRAAFASIDGSVIDQHFGSARWWQIYEIDEDGYEFIETRKPRVTGAGHDENAFAALLTLLDDCDALFVRRIGEGAASFVINRGKRVFEAEGAVADIAAALADDL